jgi:ferredoxin-NADP reductase
MIDRGKQHCDYTLTSWHYFVATAAVYVPCFVYPWLRTIFEYRLTQKAYLHAEANGFTRISIPVSFYWTPGQHCFLRFTSFGILNAVSAHPFTICSCPPMVKYEKSELVFYIRHQKGFTAKLYQHALDHPDTAVNVMVDGPYGGVNMFQLTNADDSLVIAGGSGAGWCLPFVERFLRRSSSLSGSASEDSRAFAADEKIAPVERTDVVDESASQKTLSLILATRDSASRVWFEHAVDELMSMYGVPKSGSVQVQVYLTGHAAEGAHLPRDKETTPSSSASSSSGKKKISDPETGISLAIPGQEHQGRPDLSLIIKDRALKAKEESKALSVYVCGPETMQNDVRNAVAAANLDILSSGSGSVYLHSEHFSWA